MESTPYQYTLLSLLQQKSIELIINNIKINEGEIIELNYTYMHSKSLLLLEILKEAIKKLDLVIFFDMNLSIDFSGIQDYEKILIYKIFSAPEFFMYISSLNSFLKDCKRKTIIIIDS